jgi:hypothetical protein
MTAAERRALNALRKWKEAVEARDECWCGRHIDQATDARYALLRAARALTAKSKGKRRGK